MDRGGAPGRRRFPSPWSPPTLIGLPAPRRASALTTGDADAANAAFSARGVDVDDVLRWPGVPPMFAFRDQDGNGLEIVEEA